MLRRTSSTNGVHHADAVEIERHGVRNPQTVRPAPLAVDREVAPAEAIEERILVARALELSFDDELRPRRAELDDVFPLKKTKRGRGNQQRVSHAGARLVDIVYTWQNVRLTARERGGVSSRRPPWRRSPANLSGRPSTPGTRYPPCCSRPRATAPATARSRGGTSATTPPRRTTRPRCPAGTSSPAATRSGGAPGARTDAASG
eukprot:24623-Pelagococcus_subviridis.AAC.2